MEHKGPCRGHLACLGALVIGVGVVVFCFFGVRRPPTDGEHKPAGPAVQEQFQSLFDSYNEDQRRWSQAILAARSEAEREAVQRVDDQAHARKIWSLVQNSPDDPAALGICCRIVTCFCYSDQVDEAFALLRRSSLRDSRLGEYCHQLALSLSPSAEKFLRVAREEHADAGVRIQAALALACHIRWQTLEQHARTRKQGDTIHLDHLDPTEEIRLIEEVETICQSLMEKHADMPYMAEDDEGRPAQTTIGKQARAIMDSMEQVDIRRLAPGKPAPDIRAADSKGKSLQLSEFRGKVVLLSFGGQHCTPCRQMIPHERALAERLKERPFQLIGFDRSEEDTIDGLKQFLAKENVTWRVCPGRSKDGRDLFRAWNVQGIPVFYLVDDRGEIRQRFDGYTEPAVLNAATDRLVQEAEARGGRP
ncbi:TlpA family protein disulfide reductase [Zavarzinella formosa]|uniref:TlpA family protein disulfide reductase n=1 Tax=Zavarzinella formosa TaxID=360055 RepID=UPI0002FB9651|nr:TlpA disulfide reductase family protein [Zavarzinella formosa]